MYHKDHGISKSLFVSQFFRPEFYRFLLIGGANTVFSYIVYAIFLIVLPYQIAYTIAYALGIILSYYMNSKFTFKAKLQFSKAIQYPLVYVLQYILSLGLIYILVEILHAHQLLATAIAILAVIPISYIMTRLIIKGRRS